MSVAGQSVDQRGGQWPGGETDKGVPAVEALRARPRQQAGGPLGIRLEGRRRTVREPVDPRCASVVRTGVGAAARQMGGGDDVRAVLGGRGAPRARAWLSPGRGEEAGGRHAVRLRPGPHGTPVGFPGWQGTPAAA
jgi:hypothetical protein